MSRSRRARSKRDQMTYRSTAELLIKGVGEQWNNAIANERLTDNELDQHLQLLRTGTLLASACASLAIESRLGEIVEQLQIANALRGTGHMGVLNSDAELRAARAAVRRLLGLEPAPLSKEGEDS